MDGYNMDKHNSLIVITNNKKNMKVSEVFNISLPLCPAMHIQRKGKV